MSSIRTIRQKLGVTQGRLAEALEVTQGNVSFYERGQKVPPDVAGRLIRYAAAQGLMLSYEDIYGDPLGGAEGAPEVRDAA